MTQDDFGISSVDRDRALRALITGAIRRSPLKRAAIAEALTAKLGIRVTERMLNDYTAENKKGVRFPLLFAAALCEILDDDSIALFALRPRMRTLVQLGRCDLAGLQGQREREELINTLLTELPSKHEGK